MKKHTLLAILLIITALQTTELMSHQFQRFQAFFIRSNMVLQTGQRLMIIEIVPTPWKAKNYTKLSKILPTLSPKWWVYVAEKPPLEGTIYLAHDEEGCGHLVHESWIAICKEPAIPFYKPWAFDHF